MAGPNFSTYVDMYALPFIVYWVAFSG